MRDIRFGLIIIEVRDKILNGIFRKEIPKLSTQLSRQRLIMSQHQSRLLNDLNNPSHSHGLATAGNAKQSLSPITPDNTLAQKLRSSRLIACQTVRRDQLKVHAFA